MIYSNEQVMLSLAFVSYLGFYETSFGVQGSLRTLKSLDEGLKTSRCLADHRWEIVWGPAMYRLPLTVFDENLMFVVRSGLNPARYVIVIRGTNPVSVTNWVLQDFSILVQTPWPYSSDTGGLKPKISQGTGRGLQALQHMVPRRGIPGAGTTLYQFLTQEVARRSGEQLSIEVTGHSLAGALSPTLGLWLLDTQHTSDDPESAPWDPAGQVSLSVCSFAGPSPGEADFAQYYDKKLGARTRRIWNRYDVVPHGWVTTALETLPKLYPPIKPDLFASAILWTANRLAVHGNYQHVLAATAAETDSRVSPILKDYLPQMLYQHTVAYLDIFKLLPEFDLKHFQLDEEMTHAVEDARMAATSVAATAQGGDAPAMRAAGQLQGSRRTLSQRVSAVSKGLHRVYRIPATCLMTVLPESRVLSKLRSRGARFHERRGEPASAAWNDPGTDGGAAVSQGS